jgi:hypothetical protein
MTCPGRQLGMNGVRCAERTSGGQGGAAGARRFVMVMPAGNAAHSEARVAFGLGKPCYAVGPVAKTETLYRFFDRMFASSDNSASWLASPLVTPGNGRPRGARSMEFPT